MRPAHCKNLYITKQPDVSMDIGTGSVEYSLNPRFIAWATGQLVLVEMVRAHCGIWPYGLLTYPPRVERGLTRGL